VYRLAEQQNVRVYVAIDEAWCHDESISINGSLRAGSIEATYGPDSVTVNPDASVKPWRSRPVHDLPSSDQEIERLI
jgi:hypothetical protein